MKFLVPNYSCLQNSWLGGYRPQIPVLCPLSSTEFVEPPPKKFLGTPLDSVVRMWSWKIICSQRRKSYTSNLPHDFTASRRQALRKHLYRPHSKSNHLYLRHRRRNWRIQPRAVSISKQEARFTGTELHVILIASGRTSSACHWSYLLPTRQLRDNWPSTRHT
jgi:hypothetical protein